MKNISPCLWFDHRAEEAVRYYATVFKDSETYRVSRYSKAGAEVARQKEGSVLTVDFRLEDLRIAAINGGPMFQFTPALSFFVSGTDAADLDEKWQHLSEGGSVRMGWDRYPWAEKYGWAADRFGVEWQLILTPRPQKIVPAFLFVDGLFGRGEEAVNLYTSLFPNSRLDMMDKDPETKTVRHCAFTLSGQGFVLMEGAGRHGYGFSPASSLIVNCETQDEIDRVWEGLLSEGGAAERCGWLRDRFGVSWQVVPVGLAQWMADPKTAETTMRTLLTMSKIDIAVLRSAAEG